MKLTENLCCVDDISDEFENGPLVNSFEFFCTLNRVYRDIYVHVLTRLTLKAKSVKSGKKNE